ncbi:MAG TPA: glycoside hydrolase family 38 C-terminal domain-containing protein [Bacteroidales bacterium]|nr:glycoside hydrolase family 38 C-terminal domain-containing protein [Bacteroidales bacterium]HOX74647.1 glycoside hydrolase family 38 C-terminal domain-containing protein [Bacteroidales bacterium]HPM87685.1 glycoside hydrolase family 38 C-terminal domain-containing protein [Bacteroidales bacterium]
MVTNKNQKNPQNLSRREFIGQAVAGSAVIMIGPVNPFAGGPVQDSGSWPQGAADFRVHMIGHAHIDPVWLWPWPEGMSVAYSTFRSALDRMNETPDFTFTASSAQFYQWIADNDPAMLKEIKKRVDEGRWNIVGGWWIEPDVNIPSGEALVRQGLYGQLTFQRLLGQRAKVACNPDSFGHTGTLPQIIRGQGMENYIFMRPGIREKTLPADLFWWEGPDGSRVLTYRIPISYNDTGSVRKRINDTLAQFRDQPVKKFMAYYGAGDHGGGATKENIRSINELKTEKGAPAVFYSTTDRYFREIREDKNINLPVVKDDLQHHATGCYTAESEIKKGNRQSEAALVTAEKITAVGSMAWGAKYPKKEFTSAWQKVLFLQFHDSLAGTSVPEHSLHAREGYGFALDTAHQATYYSVQKLESQVPSEDPESQYMLAFNPNAWELAANVEYDFSWNTKTPSKVEDGSGRSLAHQWIAGSTETGNRTRLVTKVSLPPLGYQQIRISKGDPLQINDPVIVKEKLLENEFLRVTFSYSGTISIFDKKKEKEIFAGKDTGCRALIINDPSDTWSHNIKTFSDEIGAFGNATFKILENGPLRGAIRVITTYGNSSLTIDWLLTSGCAMLEARVSLNWHERLKMLKFSFPVNVESPVATYETSYGNIERQTNGDEDPGQRWIDISGNNNGNTCGFTLLNDAKYGYSVHGNDLRLSVARSAVYAHHDPKVLDMKAEHIWMDQGIQTFRMVLLPHQGTWKNNNIVKAAEELLSPPVAIYQGIHGGKLPKTNSFLTVDSKNILVASIKLAESDDDLIFRCVETEGLMTDASLDLKFAGRKWQGRFKPYEIKTLRLNRKSAQIREVNLLEE